MTAVPAMVDGHSHAFQIGLRGRGERDPQDFWSWRDVMYGLVSEHDEASMRAVCTEAFGQMRAACAESFRQMRAAGYGAVGEFHYVHPLTDAVLAGAADAEAGVELIVRALERLA